MLAPYPQADENLIDEEAESEMLAVIELVSRVRNLRSEMNLKPSQQISIIVRTLDEKVHDVFSRNSQQIGRLTNSLMTRARWPDKPIEIPKASARAVLAGGAEVGIPLEGLIDFEQERIRLAKKRTNLPLKEQGLRRNLPILSLRSVHRLIR
jgi:valyl-tRNA synthetase